jgi:hypothetical protein
VRQATANLVPQLTDAGFPSNAFAFGKRRYVSRFGRCPVGCSPPRGCSRKSGIET